MPSRIKKLLSLAKQLANIEIDNILIDDIDCLRILRNEEDILRIVSLGLECMDQKLITKIVLLYKDIKFAELEKLNPNERKNEKINLLKDLVSKL
jgi:reverse gyrase